MWALDSPGLWNTLTIFFIAADDIVTADIMLL